MNFLVKKYIYVYIFLTILDSAGKQIRLAKSPQRNGVNTFFQDFGDSIFPMQKEITVLKDSRDDKTITNMDRG